MATVTWTLELVDASSTIDLTTEMLGFSITQRVPIGTVATYNGQITLDNTRNKFTPGAGGTYASLNWFTKIVRFKCTVNDGSSTSVASVADLVVRDVKYADDGARSSVTVQLTDFYSYTGRDKVEEIDVTVAYGELSSVSQDLINGITGIPRVAFPKFGASSNTVSAVNKRNNVPSEATSALAVGYKGVIDEFTSGTTRDHINLQVLPSGPSILYPTTATYSSNTWTLNSSYLNRGLSKETVSSTDYYREYEFSETDVADKYKFRAISVQFNTINAINEAQIQAVIPVTGESSNTSTDSTSQDTIGVRSVTFSKLICVSLGGATQSDKAFIGDFWVNRFKDVSFTPQKLTMQLEAAAVNIDSSSRQNLADLLDVDSGLWSVAKISYTPTGASSAQTHTSVITGRTINGTPRNTSITFELATAVDNQSLTLDSATLGLLNTYRLG